jgi:hypothetical protein
VEARGDAALKKMLVVCVFNHLEVDRIWYFQTYSTIFGQFFSQVHTQSTPA